MNIKSFATKLRRAADVLEDLLVGEISSVNETSRVADKLRKGFKKAKRKKSYNGKHWTQTARGRKIMSERTKKAKK